MMNKKVMPLIKVEIIAEVGTECGLVESAPGMLTIVVKAPGANDWPHGIVPTTGINTIAEGHRRYSVTAE
jgi:hypothetical protein